MKIIFKNQPTIEEIEKELGFKLDYPNQFVEGDLNEERYKKFRDFGCSDIMDTTGHWLHRDCLIGRDFSVCDQCNFYPIVKEYSKKYYEGLEKPMSRIFTIPVGTHSANWVKRNLKKLIEKLG